MEIVGLQLSRVGINDPSSLFNMCARVSVCTLYVPVYSTGQGSSERRNDHVQQPIISQSSRAKTGELIATRVRTAVSRFPSPRAIVCIVLVAQDSSPLPLKKILHVKRKEKEILEYSSREKRKEKNDV